MIVPTVGTCPCGLLDINLFPILGTTVSLEGSRKHSRDMHPLRCPGVEGFTWFWLIGLSCLEVWRLSEYLRYEGMREKGCSGEAEMSRRESAP